ncbi:hypothetical protein [Streptomyces sp. DSM 40750]|uniref:hypothetical protein n=1 Tax=Streptomyces sp. DSM 40750 TaxID=2801030 RepID=UPI00214BBCDF|nr:hypothetical protein [Streptomyces sp. DSM 40750]UUU21649.1 hypothetical protein JIX55_15695 [Streptomyces sp. DSM 40750]
MTDDVTRGEGIRERDARGPREARETDVGRDGVGLDGVKGSGTAPGTRRTTDTTSSADTTSSVGTTGAVGATNPAGGTSPAGATGTHAAVVAGHDRTDEHGGGGRLLPHDECDKLNLRMQHALGGFVDGPRSAVEEADHVLEEVTARFTDAMTRRRRTLRASWQPTAEDRATSADTEQLRLALRDYRELTERLLRL